jgi:signal peptidase I
VSTEEHARDDTATDKDGGGHSFWREAAILLLIAAVVAVVVRVFVMQTFYIPSGSMEETLLLNDRVLVNKIGARFGGPKRGEVVVFKPPVSWRTDPDEEDFIKRVIGVANDHVSCAVDGQGRSAPASVTGHIVVNGKALDEPYVNSDSQPCTEAFDITVPADRIFVLGDHRGASGDSRYHLNDSSSPSGTIATSDVVGRAEFIYWPVSRWRTLPVPDTFAGVPAP